jgi:hypothetical protein
MELPEELLNNTMISGEDKAKISLLYEDMYIKDFLKIEESEIDSYDWELFFEHRYMGIFSSVILEHFEKIYDNKITADGTEDLYLITLKDGNTFHLVIDYSSHDTSKTIVDERILSYNMKNETKVLASLYEKYFKDFKPNEYLGLIQFKDSQGRHKITGDVGISSHELFSSLKQAIIDSFWGGNRLDNLRGFIIRVDNNEIRRLKLYQMLVKKFLSKEFPNMFVDEESESRVGMTLLVVSK